MSEHFIKEIEIRKYKLFKDFKASGFGRVNLIGGKNNVGKTAFMEACYLSQSKDPSSLFKRLLEVKTHRDIINNLLSDSSRETDFRNLLKDNMHIEIYIEGKGGEIINNSPDEKYQLWEDGLTKIDVNRNNSTIEVYTKYSRLDLIPTQYGDEEPFYKTHPDIFKLSDLLNRLDFIMESSKYLFSKNFISPYSNSNQELENIIGDSKLYGNKYDVLNRYLLEVFNISSIDIIKNNPMVKSNGKYRELSSFGQGIKTFINIVASILLLKDDIVFIDEIDNGIHYSNFDKLWEIILKLSKEQNVQVFATTHSKECIESYARVAKKLEDEEIKFIELGRNKKGEIKSIVLDRDRLNRDLEVGNEVRGW